MVDCPDSESKCAKFDSCVTKYVWKRINNSINDSIEKISKLKDKKLEISKSMNNNKYYLTDSIDKDISILENNILNYKSMISQI